MKNIGSLIFLVIGAVAFFLIKGGLGNSAVNYNNKIVDQQASVIEKMFDLVESLKKRDGTQMKKNLRLLQEQITESADAIGQMEGYEGSTKLRDAALDLMEFYEAVSHEEFVTMVDILSKPDSEITQFDVEQIQDLERRISQEELELDAMLQQAQREFANEHDFKIQANKYQKKIDNM